MLRFALENPIVPCQPPLWAKTGHPQTILGHLLPSRQLHEKGERIEVSLPGGDRLVAHFFQGTTSLVVYLFHGLGGFSHGAYMQRTALIAREMGHTVIMSNHRGCGEGRGLAHEPYHSGRAEDLSAVIAWGRKKLPEHQHLAIGFSLSGNALLLLAAGQRAQVQPDAAIAVNAPIDLQKAADLLHVGLNRIYDFRFVQDTRRAIAVRAQLDPRLLQLKIPRLTTLHEVDRLYTAPFGGFKNREDYYQTCSAKQYLKDISIPTVLLTAKDDPFVDWQDYANAEKSDQVHMHIEEKGGHMGYLTSVRTPLKSHRWLDYALYNYIKSLK